MFDHDALLKGLAEHIQANQVFHRIGNDINWKPLSIDQWDSDMSNIAASGENGATTTTQAAGGRTQAISSQAEPIIADEIPPFDITIEYASGYAA